MFFSTVKQMAFVLPTVSVPTELLYGFLMKQISVMLTTQFQRICIAPPKPATPVVEPDDERELDQLQMDRLLKWMELVFDDSFTPVPGDSSDTRRSYKQELFNIYRTLCSDYQQYRRWKQHNQSIWLFSSYRRHDTKGLARKLLSDVRLFKEGLQLYAMIERKEEHAEEKLEKMNPHA
jgi:hypothetical protein